MKIKIACLKKACLERKLKTGDKFLPRRGAADLGQWRGNFFCSGAANFSQWCEKIFAVVRQIFCSGGSFVWPWRGV